MEKKFQLDVYRKENRDAKLDAFFMYLFEALGEDENSFDAEIFGIIDAETLIDSLQSYIEHNATSQITGNNYVTHLIKFYKMLDTEYGIQNKVFQDLSLKEKFQTDAKHIIEKLNPGDSRDIATDEQYEQLNAGIEEYLSHLEWNDILQEVYDIHSGKSKNSHEYHAFTSIIPIKLAMKYAMSNADIVKIQVDDLHMESRVLVFNDFRLPLDTEMLELFERYQELRDLVIKLYSIEENNLFIKYDGTPYCTSTKNRKNVPDNSSFYKIMKMTINTQSADLFAARRTIELLAEGIDIATVSKLTGKQPQKIMQLQKRFNDGTDLNEHLYDFFNNNLSESKRIRIRKKGMLRCPFCGEYKSAKSENWILVKFPNSDDRIISCAVCKGGTGKFEY